VQTGRVESGADGYRQTDAAMNAPNAQSCTFGSLRISYDDRVLAPRSWTEAQSRWVADLSARAPAGAIAELCAGAGHIGLLAAVLTGRPLVQVEADAVAADFARGNAAATAAAPRVEVRTKPIQSAFAAGERFPLLIADPPYLPTAEVARFPDDPLTAIDGGPDGLALLGVCLDVTTSHLLDDGAAVFQVAGPAQADSLARMCEGSGLAAHERRVVDDERALVLLRPQRLR